MKKSKWLAVLAVAAIVAGVTYGVVAQQSTTATEKINPRSVALVDVAYIISQDASIETQMAQLNTKYTKLIQENAQEAKEVEKMRDVLATYDRNSDKYRETEQQMLSRIGDLQSRESLLVKQATEERIQIFTKTYDNVVRHTERCAKAFGMTVIFNYNRTKLTDNVPLLNNPQQYENFWMQYTQVAVSRPVVWANAGQVDLTNLVLAEIQKANPATVRPAESTVSAQSARPAGAVGTQATIPARTAAPVRTAVPATR